MSPVWPPSRLTKAPKWVIPVTVPSTVWPTSSAAATPLAAVPLADDPFVASGWVSGSVRSSNGWTEASGCLSVSVSPVPEISDPPPDRFPQSALPSCHLALSVARARRCRRQRCRRGPSHHVNPLVISSITMLPRIFIGGGPDAAGEEVLAIAVVRRCDSHVLLPEVGRLRIQPMVEQHLLGECVTHPDHRDQQQRQHCDLFRKRRGHIDFSDLGEGSDATHAAMLFLRSSRPGRAGDEWGR